MRIPRPSPSSLKTVLALLSTLLVTTVGTILADLYVHRTSLELQLLAQSTIAEGAGGLDKLQVTYDKRVIPGLSRTELRLINTGYLPIESKQMVAPIELAVDSGRIVDVRTDEVTPRDVKVNITVDRTGKSATFAVPLLNPGESVRFTLLVDHAPAPTVRVTARAPRLGPIVLTDRRTQTRSVWGSLGWLVYFAACGSVSAFVLLVWFSYRIGYIRNERHLWRGRSYLLPNSLTPLQFIQFSDVIFGDPALDARVRDSLAGLPENRIIPQPNLAATNETIEKYIRNVRILANRILFVLLFLLVASSAYVIYSVINTARTLAG